MERPLLTFGMQPGSLDSIGAPIAATPASATARTVLRALLTAAMLSACSSTASVGGNLDGGSDASLTFDASRSYLDAETFADAGAAHDAATDPDAGHEPDCTDGATEILAAAPGEPAIVLRALHDFGDHWLVFHEVFDPEFGPDYVVVAVDRRGHVVESATLPRMPRLVSQPAFLPISVSGPTDEVVAFDRFRVVRYARSAGAVTAFGGGLPIEPASVAFDPTSSVLFVVQGQPTVLEPEWFELRPDDTLPEGLTTTAPVRLGSADGPEIQLVAAPDRVLAYQSRGTDIRLDTVRILPDRTVVPLPSFDWVDPPGWMWSALRDPSSSRWLFLMSDVPMSSVDLYAFEDADPPTAPVLLGSLVTPADGFTNPWLSFTMDRHGTALFAVFDFFTPSRIIFRSLDGELFRDGLGPAVRLAPPADPTSSRFAAVYALEVDAAGGVRRLGLRCIDIPPAAP